MTSQAYLDGRNSRGGLYHPNAVLCKNMVAYLSEYNRGRDELLHMERPLKRQGGSGNPHGKRRHKRG